jgi:hypothetical protein
MNTTRSTNRKIAALSARIDRFETALSDVNLSWESAEVLRRYLEAAQKELSHLV